MDYPSFKLVLVGDGGTGEAIDLVVSSLSVALECCRTFDKLRLLFMPSCREDDVREEAHHWGSSRSDTNVSSKYLHFFP